MQGEATRQRVVVHGRVQGVFFRETTAEEASKHGVAGWVRNRDDGAVEAVFEGDPGAVERMIDFCRQGPSSAGVDEVESFEESPEGLSGFSVR